MLILICSEEKSHHIKWAGFYNKRVASFGYWANKWHIYILISKAALIVFMSAYWNAKAIVRQIDRLIDFTIDWQAKSINPFWICPEKEFVLVLVQSSSLAYTFSTSWIHLPDSADPLLMITEILNKNGLMFSVHKSAQQTVILNLYSTIHP